MIETIQGPAMHLIGANVVETPEGCITSYSAIFTPVPVSDAQRAIYHARAPEGAAEAGEVRTFGDVAYTSRINDNRWTPSEFAEAWD